MRFRFPATIRRSHAAPFAAFGPVAQSQRPGPPRHRRALRPRRGRLWPLLSWLGRSGLTAFTRAGKRAAFPISAHGRAHRRAPPAPSYVRASVIPEKKPLSSCCPSPRSRGTVSTFGPVARCPRLSRPPCRGRVLSHPPGGRWPLLSWLRRSGLTAPTRAGKRVAFPCPIPIGRGHRRGHVDTLASLGRVPQRHSSSARPAIGGRFAPAGAGTGLSVTG